MGRRTILACGFLESRDGAAVRASELQVFACGSNEPLLNFDATQSVHLVRRGEALVVSEVQRWPFGPHWNWVDVPIWEFVVRQGSPPSVSKTLVLRPPELTPARVSAVLALYEKAIVTSPPEPATEDLIGRLLACALAGSGPAVRALLDLSNALPVDGHAGEVWAEAVAVYRLHTERAAPRSEHVAPNPSSHRTAYGGR